ncbi:tRNA 2-thiocytidine(32) synthetase TtcA [Paludibacter sp. 221]|uniref:ATP-binding protein n=1 Tax=Paludibacter sp. 221 TaxID=2302939 RepID=UPI0013D31CF8|nr:ATP-binding protein [Paludibacter sp. 221]NDV45961.1 tRNA 2-thiocytidine(32) synthetase TtcA [Paludibacter sp. 221]
MQREKTEYKIINDIQSRFNKAIRDYGLIDDGDHLLVGLSGGKDSLALTELLGERMKVFSPKFKVSAVHVSVENIPYKSDLDFLRSYSEGFNIPFVHRVTRYDESTDTRKSNCFLCSWNRRKVLFDTAKELGCNKIVLGHHLDDMVETLLLNMFFQGAMGTMPPKLKMTKFDMTIIRPMALIPESGVSELARIRNYPKQIKNCPFEKESSRTKIKELIKQVEQWHPSVRQSIAAAMENIQTEYLPLKINK